MLRDIPLEHKHLHHALQLKRIKPLIQRMVLFAGTFKKVSTVSENAHKGKNVPYLSGTGFTKPP